MWPLSMTCWVPCLRGWIRSCHSFSVLTGRVMVFNARRF
jgi:hypothetical protein